MIQVCQSYCPATVLENKFNLLKYCCWPNQHPPSFLSTSSLEPPSIASGWILEPSHLPTSLYQLRTRLEGETTIALLISGLPSGLWRRRVQIKVIHCRVFPRPISSAIMLPYELGIHLPVTQSQRNFTP